MEAQSKIIFIYTDPRRHRTYAQFTSCVYGDIFDYRLPLREKCQYSELFWSVFLIDN